MPMISSTSATVPGAGGGATTEGQGEEEEGLRLEDEVEVEVEEASDVVAAAAADDDLESLRRRCFPIDCDPKIADLERRGKEVLSSTGREAEACLGSAARREIGDAKAAVELTATTTRDFARQPAPLTAALAPQPQPREAAAGFLISGSMERLERNWRSSARER